MSDLIDRQAAIDEAVAYIEEWNNAKSKYHKKEITRRFQNLPSAQPERRTGQWIKIHWKAYRCSECNRVSEYSTDYCPNCGAKMEGDTDATD